MPKHIQEWFENNEKYIKFLTDHISTLEKNMEKQFEMNTFLTKKLFELEGSKGVSNE